jgi:HEAT repeat protein
MKMERTIEDLIADLKSTDDFTREEAIGELEMKGDEVVDPLIDALSDRNKNVKIAAIQILANIGDEKAIEPIIGTLKDPNKLVRREASTALTNMGDAAVEPLIGVLDDPNWRVRGAACWALGGLNAAEAVPKLEELLDDEKSFVRAGAEFAIKKLK